MPCDWEIANKLLTPTSGYPLPFARLPLNQGLIESQGCGFLKPKDYMAVNVERERYGAMTQPIRDYLCVNSCFQHEGSMGMVRVVQPYTVQAYPSGIFGKNIGD